MNTPGLLSARTATGLAFVSAFPPLAGSDYMHADRERSIRNQSH